MLLEIVLAKKTTEFVLLFHKHITKLILLWHKMGQRSFKVLSKYRIKQVILSDLVMICSSMFYQLLNSNNSLTKISWFIKALY